MEELTLYSVMQKSAPSIGSDQSVADTLKYLHDLDRHYCVVTTRDKMVGVVCLCDLRNAEGNDKVGSCIQGPLVFVSSSESIAEAAEKMLKEGVGFLPVMFRKRVLGFVTRTHLRNAGVAHEFISNIPTCSACNSDKHVRLKDGCILMGFCRDCMDHMENIIPFSECGGEG